MATYTPNLNLYKPDSSDPFADFRTKFNNNMDILDNGGGGGGGGHTIVDENGQSMPSRLKLAFTGNVEVTDDSGNNETLVNILGGGGGGSDTIVGMFVDTSRIITSGTWASSLSYTATEDCFVYVEGTTNNTHLIINIDGVKVFDLGSSNFVAQYKLYPLKKGQVLTATKSDGFTLNYIVYGVTQGTKGIFTPIIYSDSERCIGIWRDNKPLYQKTVIIPALPSTAYTATNYAHNIANIDSVVKWEGFAEWSTGIVQKIGTVQFGSSGIANTSSTFAQVDKTNITILVGTDRSAVSGRFTLFYTKTTDVAGSGNWSTDEEPMHHYSTSEKIVGTWIDGKPVYEKTIEFPITSTLGSGFNTIESMPNIVPISIKGFLVNRNDGRVYPLNYSNAGATSSLFYYQGNITLNIQNDSWGTTYKLYVIVEYTKITD